MNTCKKISFILLFCCFSASAQTVPLIQWLNLFGGAAMDIGKHIISTDDGGYMLCGTTSSSNFINGLHGSSDIYVIKLDSNRNIAWSKCYGGSSVDIVNSFIKTSDNHFVIAGLTSSADGDVSTHHGAVNITDCWVLKINSTGTIIWERSYGGSLDDQINSIVETPDNGFLFTGHTFSNDIDVSGLHGNSGLDAWVVKVDRQGNIQWQKCVGGSKFDLGELVINTNDSLCIVAGKSRSDDGDMPTHYGSLNNYDVFLLSMYTHNGAIKWIKIMGSTGTDNIGDMIINNEGDIIIGICNGTNDIDFSWAQRAYDYCLLCLDSSSNKKWAKSYGGSKSDVIRAIIQSKRGGYLLGGMSYSDDGHLTKHYGNASLHDLWFIKVDDDGNPEWQKTVGGSDNDVFGSMIQLKDSGYVVTTYTLSNDNDLSGQVKKGDYDNWVFKLKDVPTSISLLEHSNGNIVVYPTINTGMVYIDFGEWAEGVEIRLINAAGQIISAQASTYNNKNFTVSNMPNGNYTLVITSANGNTSYFKIVTVK